MREFADNLEKEGYAVFRHDGHAQSPWHVLQAALDNAQHLLLRDALPLVRTRYTVFLDGDSWPVEDLGRACAAMGQHGSGLASVIVRPSRSSSWIEKLQDVEYQFAMVMRRYRSWLTSGACIIGQTDVLRTVMMEHTTYFYGGDIEVGRLANRLCNVCHLDLTVKTDVPQTFPRWFRQRIGWWAGSFRHSIVNFDKDLFRAPLWTLYGTGIIWGLFGLRWLDLSKHWYVIPLLLAIYLSLNIVMGLRFKIRSRWLLAYPFYALFQSLALPPFGLYRYIKYSLRNRTWGRLRV